MAQVLTYGMYALLTLAFIVHVALAIGVWADATQRVIEKKPVVFSPPSIWALAALGTGIFGVTVYWLIHHSALRRLYGKESTHDHNHGHAHATEHAHAPRE